MNPTEQYYYDLWNKPMTPPSTIDSDENKLFPGLYAVNADDVIDDLLSDNDPTWYVEMLLEMVEIQDVQQQKTLLFDLALYICENQSEYGAIADDLIVGVYLRKANLHNSIEQFQTAIATVDKGLQLEGLDKDSIGGFLLAKARAFYGLNDFEAALECISAGFDCQTGWTLGMLLTNLRVAVVKAQADAHARQCFLA